MSVMQSPMQQPYVQDYALTLNRLLEHAAKWHPQSGLVTATDSGTILRCSYEQLIVRAHAFSASLRQLGVKLGDRVATLAWNTQGHVEALPPRETPIQRRKPGCGGQKKSPRALS